MLIGSIRCAYYMPVYALVFYKTFDEALCVQDTAPIELLTVQQNFLE